MHDETSHRALSVVHSYDAVGAVYRSLIAHLTAALSIERSLRQYHFNLLTLGSLAR